jgi:hypothetical protein
MLVVVIAAPFDPFRVAACIAIARAIAMRVRLSGRPHTTISVGMTVSGARSMPPVARRHVAAKITPGIPVALSVSLPFLAVACHDIIRIVAHVNAGAPTVLRQGTAHERAEQERRSFVTSVGTRRSTGQRGADQSNGK